MNELSSLPHFAYCDLKIAILGKGIFQNGAIRLQQELQELGVEAKFFEAYEDCLSYHPNCIIVADVIHYDYKKFTDRSILWVAINGEQLPTPETGGGLLLQKRLKQVKKYCKYFDLMFDYNESNIRLIKTFFKGRVERVERNRYPANPEIPDFIPDEEKEYDLLFYGSKFFQRRAELVNFLSERYRFYPKVDNLWGDDLVEAIKKSKICLNLHAEETRYFEKMRFMQLFSNHAFVLSDRVYDSGRFKDGEDFATFFLTNLTSRIDYYLAHEEERKQMADNAYQKVKDSEKTEDRFATVILDAILLERYRKQIFDNPPLTARIKRRVGVLLKRLSKGKNE